jgi:glycosyltransferase involved in cell wall biosynthesis
LSARKETQSGIGSFSPHSYAIVANGFAEGPAQALRDYLVARDADVVTVFHPLTSEQGTRHEIAEYSQGGLVRRQTRQMLLQPPASFLLDPFVPLFHPRVDVWFGFNPLACARGLVARRHGRARFVALWSVDFVPDRFGPGTMRTRVYDYLDKLSATRSDARIELSEAAREGRNRRHALGDDSDRTHVVPMGAWVDRLPTTPADGFARRRVVFLGHLVPRQGVDLLLQTSALLKERDLGIIVDVIGGGPAETELRRQADTLGVGEVIRFHGFVPDHQDVERLLAEASLAVAPYRPGLGTFTSYADPGKLKAYVAAGLPTVLTDVPPNAQTLAREAGAEVVAYDATAFADAIELGLASPDRWRERRHAALAYALRFDWNRLLGDLFRELGFEPH